MRTLIVTAANDAFMPLLRGLVESLHQWKSRPFTDFACFDLGLTPENRQWIAGYAAHIVEPQWDLSVNKTLREKHPEWRAYSVRPFLPKYFPGYEIYLWIDADTWVQERFALEWYITIAAERQLAITPEVDRAYHHTAHLVNWRTSRMHSYFGSEAAALLPWKTYFNAGVFALRSDMPHWDLWAKWFSVGLEATQGKVFCDQTALNYAIWKEQLPISPLPAICNWTCHLALPHFDCKLERFCEPVWPSNPIGILHLTAHTKDISLEVPNHESIKTISLRFPTPLVQHNSSISGMG